MTGENVRPWRSRTLEIVERIFGVESRQAQDFAKVRMMTTMRVGWFDQQRAADIASHDRSTRVDMREAKAFLTALIEELNEDGLPEKVENDRPALSAMEFLEKVFNRFQKIEHQLRRRRQGRNTLEVKDEYDLQDSLHALLWLHFDDVRPEECTPSYAGKGPRMDFLLKEEGIVVEVKMTRDGLGEAAVGSQLIEDIARYGTHPDCRTLVCFVYDPEHRIANRRGLEGDLSGEREREGMGVRVVVRPE